MVIILAILFETCDELALKITVFQLVLYNMLVLTFVITKRADQLSSHGMCLISRVHLEFVADNR